ncbi:ABC-2 transporter permease [Sporolactobacillus sp. THM19-2]|jgi:ABC-2 type transport system permease protein|uniref:ABC-2 transporter permease n=1 Tax=Sporolactobacillus sp. THM19-2 TaxID=2511171 RepID=UPI0013EBE3AF|nr:ABC-2 transporter permease [Sporolactobacillus sp. THM19-2]
MFHLMVKDIYTQRVSAYLAPLLLLLYFITAGNDVTGSEFMGIVLCGTGIGFIAYYMIIASNFNTNEGDKWNNRLLISLPVTRRSMILSKYLMILIWWVFAYISSTVLILFLNSILNFHLLTPLSIETGIMSLCLSIFLSSIFYPIFFRFGYRVASMVGIGLFFAIMIATGTFISWQKMNLQKSVPEVIRFSFDHPVIPLIILTLLVSLISYFLSTHIFEKKEF